MRKIKSCLFILFCLPLISVSQVVSPEAFLGYEIGTRFTPWHKVVQYFEKVAEAKPDAVHLEQYGETYEGRPMIVAIVGSKKNILQLEQIRHQQLDMTGMNGALRSVEEQPVVVWLSYNVHGNEASSTEVSMRMLYELVSGTNSKAAAWLENTVVIIDPCLNPDGRDRYVNWYNAVSGKEANPSMLARERYEPWVRGRSNHYYHDLNRDWAWQSQIETQQRMVIYQKWMPAIHVDFHEQYYDSPYYFAPAAEPQHDALTGFQRSFQYEIGANHAKYFDQNGWFYFTRQYFDLFYPAYGDTYPMFNGAIGMTYEQAGHSMGGLTIAWDKDTLTLKDRVAHHYTTGMSTIEVASANAVRINKAFKQYFEETLKNGNGIYKTFVVDGSSPDKTESLLTLLKLNKINYTIADKATSVKGFEYFSKREVAGNIQIGDILISTRQPKGTLVRVLFEPVSALKDSLTYDITAWALPYVYGLKTLALKENYTGVEPKIVSASKVEIADNAYAYLYPYNAFKQSRFMAALLKTGIKIRYSEDNFITNGKEYTRGTLMILKSENKDKLEALRTLSEQFQLQPTVMQSGMMEKGADMGSDKVRLIRKPVIGILAGDKAFENSLGELWHYFDRQLDYPVILINSNNANELPLEKVDILIIPSGYFSFLSDKDGNKKLTEWLRGGGKLIAIEKSVELMASGEWQIKLKESPADSTPATDEVPQYANREKDQLDQFIQGAIYKVDLDYTHPLAFGFTQPYFTLKNSGKSYQHLTNGWNVGVIKKDGWMAGLAGKGVKPQFDGSVSIATQSVGRGQVVYFMENPLFRSFWESGKQLFANAIFFNW